MTKPVDIIGAEDMLIGMANSAKAVAPKVAATAIPPYKLPTVGPDEVSGVNQGPVMHHPETFLEAVGKLPGQATDWVGHHDFGDMFGGLDDWLHHLNFAAPLAGLANILTGGLLTWLTAAFLGLRIFSMVRGFAAPAQRSRGPVNLVYYQVPVKAAEPVAAYLTNGQQIEVRGIQPDGQGNAMIGVPIYHSGRTNRAMAHLQTETGLEWKRL